jgi:hypothetical protein
VLRTRHTHARTCRSLPRTSALAMPQKAKTGSTPGASVPLPAAAVFSASGPSGAEPQGAARGTGAGALAPPEVPKDVMLERGSAAAARAIAVEGSGAHATDAFGFRAHAASGASSGGIGQTTPQTSPHGRCQGYFDWLPSGMLGAYERRKGCSLPQDASLPSVVGTKMTARAAKPMVTLSMKRTGPNRSLGLDRNGSRVV